MSDAPVPQQARGSSVHCEPEARASIDTRPTADFCISIIIFEIDVSLIAQSGRAAAAAAAGSGRACERCGCERSFRLARGCRDLSFKSFEKKAAEMSSEEEDFGLDYKNTLATALVDGCNGMGQVIGKYCMELAIEKACQFGIGMVSARGSNHYGISGYYSLMAMERGLIGFSCTNTSPLMVPTRSKQSALGTNPLSLGMSASDGDEFVLDMATTAVALGKIELAKRKQEKIPEGWALDAAGKVTTDAVVGVEQARLLPLGGEEQHSGYKGYGLATMVEVLCGVLSGSLFGPNIRLWKDASGKVANLGQCFMAINPEVFAPGSKDRLADLLKQLRGLPQAGEKPIMVAGDPERCSMSKVDSEGGITYHPNQIQNSADFAKELGVEPMKLVKKNSCSC